uniref:Replicase large subunit n=1 Tax=Uromyces virgavirus E TaxID=2592727 RepID=A0A7G3W8S7_9VIRU|nr:putative RdRp [Uromyces virgavirus E]
MAGNMDDDDRSVGTSLMRNAPLSTEHPLFKAVALQTSLRLKEIMKREDVRRRSTKKMLCFVSLDAEESAVLRAVFPEFSTVEYGCSKPGHGYYHAIRDLANEWCVMQAERYTKSIAHFGGSANIHLQSGRHDVHIVGDRTDDVYAHMVHESVLDASRMAKDVVSVSRTLGRVVAPVALLNFLNCRSLHPCRDGHCCFHAREALIVDGSMVTLSPHQVAAAMLQVKATVAFGFFPYVSSMMVSDEGRLDRTGILFRRKGHGDSAEFEFVYPQGRCGVTGYPLPVWAAWVKEQVIELGGCGKESYFQLELLDNRGPFMFYRMVKLGGPPKTRRFIHALDLPQNKELYTVISWRLKHVGCDSRVESSWEKCTFTAERRLIDRVYSFGMQLAAKDFTRFALRKQLKMVNDRVVVNGTAVTWHAPLSPDEVDQLSVALFSRLFVDRYDAGKLSSELMSRLRAYAEFDSAPFIKKLTFIASMCLTGMWDSTLLHLDEKIRHLCDSFHRFINGGNTEKVVSVHRPPTYVTMEQLSGAWFDRVKAKFMPRPAYPKDYVVPTFPGVLCTSTHLPRHPVEQSQQDLAAIYSDVVDVPGKLIVAVDEGSTTAVNLSERELDTVREEALSLVASLNELDHEPVDRHEDLSIVAKRIVPEVPSVMDFLRDPDPVHSFNEVYERCMPGNALVESQRDMASNAFDPQDRNLSAVYMRMGLSRDAPKPVKVFKSRLKALNVTKRQDVLSELLSAASARNTDPPVVSKPQDFSTLLPDIWRRFKQMACRDDVDELLAKYQSDPVALGEMAFVQWMDQAKDQNVIKRICNIMSDHAKAVEEYDVGQYMMMIKADVKVPLSTKVQGERIEPQVIVYHDKMLSAGYSAIFRVLVTRFLSILKTNVHINLRKDSRDIAGFINALHPFDLLDTGQVIDYLENDFSKYDKSQLELVFTLEKFLFEKLGMNQTFVDAWFMGHIDCKLRSLVHAFTLHVAWQRKSGDATTAFGNVVLNCMSVLYAYPVSTVYWMVFMGDDSIVCAERVAGYDEAVKVLAEVFNLQAKTYITSAPYFASNFIVINKACRTVGLLPDPIKRIERWSMSVGENEANFDEKFESARDVCGLYRYKIYTDVLKYMVPQRYMHISVGDTEIINSGIATVISDKDVFCGMWENKLELELC